MGSLLEPQSGLSNYDGTGTPTGTGLPDFLSSLYKKLEELGVFAFFHCPSLQTVTLSNSITSINEERDDKDRD